MFKPVQATVEQPREQALTWPKKFDVLGVKVSATAYEPAVDALMAAAHAGQPALATFLPVHGLVTAATDALYCARINQFDLVGPDGQPVRWAMNLLHKTNLTDRVYGPELTLRLCRRAAVEGISIFLYGSTPDVLDPLAKKLIELAPGLVIAGVESPPFRPLTEQEQHDTCDRINASGAKLVFIGLGCPRQDVFAHDHKHQINAVQLCVGAAFDFHAGAKKMAPAWMQKRGLEWLFRLCQEPGRLWKRYFVTNSLFLLLMGRRLILGPARPAV